MKIGMIGLGNMGTAIANNIARNGHKVVGWDYFQDVADEVNKSHKNTKCLKCISKLSPNLSAATDVNKVLADKDIVFVALPSTYIINVLNNTCNTVISPSTIVVNLSKGLEETTYRTSSELLKTVFCQNEIIVLSGPSIANEFARDLPCGVVLAGKSRETLYKVAQVVETAKFRTRFSDDVIGVEWSGILKNIYAIGLGIIHGAKIDSINFEAAYLTRALEEMADLIEALGGHKKSVYYLAGLGDLIATSLSEHSHNRMLGELLAKGLTFDQAKKKMGVLPEGLKALRVATYLAEKYHTAMPVAEGIHRVIEGDLKPLDLVNKFMRMGV
jgi:glycerol-3-phosphate dehydrogenase (NAD(P)+)